MGEKQYSPRDLAMGGVFGAAALLLPVLFHLFHVGSVFMPMYLPLVALAFIVRPVVAITTSFLVPLFSAVVTGMPPLYPPVAPIMAIEIAVMAAIISSVYQKRPWINEWLLLIPVLLLGRFIFVGLVYAASLWFDLPAAFLAGVSFISGWPGLILMIVVIPPFVRRFKHKPVFTPAH